MPNTAQSKRYMNVGGGKEGGEEEFSLHGYSVSVWEDKNVLERDSDHSCTTVGQYLTTQSCMLKNG